MNVLLAAIGGFAIGLGVMGLWIVAHYTDREPTEHNTGKSHQ